MGELIVSIDSVHNSVLVVLVFETEHRVNTNTNEI